MAKLIKLNTIMSKLLAQKQHEQKPKADKVEKEVDPPAELDEWHNILALREDIDEIACRIRCEAERRDPDINYISWLSDQLTLRVCGVRIGDLSKDGWQKWREERDRYFTE